MINIVAVSGLILSLLMANAEMAEGFENEEIAVYEAFLHWFDEVHTVGHRGGLERCLLNHQTAVGHSLMLSPEPSHKPSAAHFPRTMQTHAEALSKELRTRMRVYYPIIPDEMYDTLTLRNREPARFGKGCFKTVSPEILDEKKWEEVDKSKDLIGIGKSFREQFPGKSRVLTLSRVAYSADTDRALLTYSISCPGGGNCGAGGFALLEKTRGKWKVNVVANTWTS